MWKGFYPAVQPSGECSVSHLHSVSRDAITEIIKRKDVAPWLYCDNRWWNKQPLFVFLLSQSHQRQHNKDKPYKCPNCYRAYSDSASLQIHLSAHAIKNAKAYCCSMCGRAYTSVSEHGSSVIFMYVRLSGVPSDGWWKRQKLA